MPLHHKRFSDKHLRARWWDYSREAMYFITFKTADRERILGRIENEKMVLSEAGEIVKQEWEKSFEIRKELFCDVYQIMPDHVHAIVRITETIDSAVDSISAVDSDGRPNPLLKNNFEVKKYGVAYRPPKSVSSFIAGFKSSATKRINEYRQTPRKPVWQSKFHDRIIRNALEYIRISKYIANNPAKWEKDHPET